MKSEAKPLILVVLTLFIGLASAALLDSLAHNRDTSTIILLAGIGAVLAINALRLLLWSYIHKHYRLSNTYPLTALFFPLILGLALIKGEAPSLNQYIGVAFITFGVFQLFRSGRTGDA